MSSRAQVKQKVHRGLVVAYSPSSVSQVIAQAIVQAPAKEQRKIMDRFVEIKQRELGTVIVSVYGASILKHDTLVLY